MLIIKSRSFLNRKYDIIKGQKIGQLIIPLTRLIPSLQFGDILFHINNEKYSIRVLLKGYRTIGYVPSGYRLIKENAELASTDFPVRGTDDTFQIKWNDHKITFSSIGERTQVYLDDKGIGGFYEKKGIKTEAVLEIHAELSIELQVFCYLAHLKYSRLN